MVQESASKYSERAPRATTTAGRAGSKPPRGPKVNYEGGLLLDVDQHEELPSFEVLEAKLATVRDGKHLARPAISMRTGKNAQSALESRFFQDPVAGKKPVRDHRTNPLPGTLIGQGMANAV